jgi:hypothetical protein
MKKTILDFFYSIIFIFIWYKAYVFMLKYLADSPYFIYDDPVLWFLFFVGYYHLDDK